MTQNWSLDHCKLNLFPQFSANQLFWELFGVGYLLVMSLPSLLGYTLELYLSQTASNQWKSSTRKHTTDIFLLHCTGEKPWNPTDFEIEPQKCICKQRPHKSLQRFGRSLTFWTLLFECLLALLIFTPETVVATPGGGTTFSTAGASRLRSTNPRAKPVGFRNFNQWGPSPYKFDTWPRWNCFDKHVNCQNFDSSLCWKSWLSYIL